MRQSKILRSIIIFLLALCLLAGCEESPSESLADIRMDDTYYVADLHSILILCKGDGNPEYLEAIRLLKGDKASVMDGIERLAAMEQTPAVMNAIGVGYLRLSQHEEAREILNKALSLSKDDSEDVCIVNNLGSLRLVTTEEIINDDATLKYEHILNKEMNPMDRLVIRANRLFCGPLVYLYDDNWAEKITNEVHQLLEDERELLGKNYIAGIYGYMALAYCCAEDEIIEACNKVLELNDSLYPCKAIDICAYRELTASNYLKEDYQTALEYSEKWVMLTEDFLSESDTDYIKARYDKVTLLIREKRYDEAIQCNHKLMEIEGAQPIQASLIYLKSAEAYYGKSDYHKANEMIKKAWELFLEVEYAEGDTHFLLEKYSGAEHMKDDPDYMQWLQEQLEKKLKQGE